MPRLSQIERDDRDADQQRERQELWLQLEKNKQPEIKWYEDDPNDSLIVRCAKRYARPSPFMDLLTEGYQKPAEQARWWIKKKRKRKCKNRSK